MSAEAPRTRLGRRLKDLRIPRKLAVVITVHLVHAGVLLLVATYGLKAVDASRAYVAGEGLWSKAQKDAVLHLVAFAGSRDEAEFRAYRGQVNLTLGDRQARLELEKPDPDEAVVRAGFERGGNHPDDVAGMAWLYGTFRHESHIERAVAAWTRADENMTALMALADQLHAEMAAPQPDPHADATMAAIQAANARLTGLEIEFSNSLGDGARFIRLVVLVGTLSLTALFVGGALLVSTIVARQLSSSARLVGSAAKRMAEGDLEARVPVQGRDEMGGVAAAFNEMAGRLKEVSLDAKSQGDALRLSVEQFQLVAERAPIGIFRIDARGSIEYANRKWMEIAGCDYHDFLAVRRAVHADDQPGMAVRWRHAFATGTEFLDVFRYVHSDGRVVECSTRATPVRDPGGALAGFVGILEDIGERRRDQAEQQRAERQRKEIEALRAISDFRTQFINTAAHELRTPLMPLRAQIGRLRTSSVPRSADEENSLLILDRNISRLATLVEDFLQAAQIQARRLSLEARNTDVKALVRAAVAAARDKAAARQVAVEEETLGDVTAWCDGERIAQVLQNLLDNALKFSPPGGKVRIEAIGSAETVEVRVGDEGIGLRAEDLPKLFAPFSQVHDTRQVSEPGSGLGLYISKAIVELHHGRMGAESPGRGHGATFWFRIPKAARKHTGETP
ncbi:MAG: hypothetical protein QOI63_863 [Thermoplasmata archaeon]|jgi:PAS domain S-box-containing protein|nr:hypothetical protein [Thermoplasmata archaeon]